HVAYAQVYVPRPSLALRATVAVHAPLHRILVESCPVMELHVLAKGEGDRFSVARGLPLLRKPRDDVAFRIDAHERVVDPIHDVAVDEEPGKHRVEIADIVLEREGDASPVNGLAGRRRG